MKKFLQLIVEPEGDLFKAYLTCELDYYQSFLLTTVGKNPVEATSKAYEEFLKDYEGWPLDGYEIDRSGNLKNMTCPQCNKEFILEWRDYSEKSTTLCVHDCLSGGIYLVEIKCPHCNYVEEL